MDPRFLVSNRPTLPALLCLICALVSLAVAAQGDTACSAPTGDGSQSTCVCQTDAGQIIDLRPLAKSDGKAKYVTVSGACHNIYPHIHRLSVLVHSDCHLVSGMSVYSFGMALP